METLGTASALTKSYFTAWAKAAAHCADGVGLSSHSSARLASRVDGSSIFHFWHDRSSLTPRRPACRCRHFSFRRGWYSPSPAITFSPSIIRYAGLHLRFRYRAALSRFIYYSYIYHDAAAGRRIIRHHHASRKRRFIIIFPRRTAAAAGLIVSRRFSLSTREAFHKTKAPHARSKKFVE